MPRRCARAKQHRLLRRAAGAPAARRDFEARCAQHRKQARRPHHVSSLVDTCAAEFEAFTPYYYSSYGDENEVMPSDGKKKIMILGGGPNRIGQGIEFDYCCVHAAFALREAGYETIMVNSNPETVSTDYDTSDRLVLRAADARGRAGNLRAGGAACGVIVQFGGQTPLNLASALEGERREHHRHLAREHRASPRTASCSPPSSTSSA
jgi:hypothetical protein